MSDNLKELEQRCDEAQATMKRIVSGVGSAHTFDEGAAAIRATGEAVKAFQTAKIKAEMLPVEAKIALAGMNAEMDAVVTGMIEHMLEELAKVDRRVAAIVQRGRHSDHSRN
jgi:hypothetical protein